MNALMTLEEARGWLRAAVDTQGEDFIYNPGFSSGFGSCSYVPIQRFGSDDPRAKTGCLIGTALGLAGRVVQDLSGSILMHSELYVLNPEATRYFVEAQVWQDKGSTWGHAYQMAEELRQRMEA